MIIKNALLKSGLCDILIEDGKIAGIGKFSGKDEIDAGGKRVIPGLIDTHVHGFGGYDASDDKLEYISKRLANEGTTSWLPTTMTDSIENLKRITDCDIKLDGANIIGFHLEGPYISIKRKGAQNESYIKAPNLDEFKSLKNVKKITLAPELEGTEEFINGCGCSVSIGHTDCDYETALKAIDAGASCLTHTFNAMPPMLHRAPGPVGAGVEKNIYAEVICDGRHVAKPVVLALYKMFTSDRLILVSDTIRPAGLPDGEYSSGGIDVVVKDNVITLKDGVLAGGSYPLLKCVKTAVSFGIDFYEAVKMATETPAKHLKLNKGVIKEGYDADLLIIDDDFNLLSVIIGGRKYR